jgi:trk system potassium uptake protein TrkH
MGLFKKINKAIIYNLLGLLLIMNGGFMFIACFIEWYFDQGLFIPLIFSSLTTLSVGFLLYFRTKNSSKKISNREGYLVVALGWILLTLTGTLPYFFSLPYINQEVLKVNNLSFVNLIFESVSGYTTTGATILNDIEIMPKSLLFWRSLTHWIGGMGIIVLTIAILPFLGIGGMQLFMAEAPGITADKLHPRITDTAKRLWIIYILFTLIQAVLLKFAGMNWFDAINHAMSTLSTGGFSTKNASLAYWNNMPIIHYITIFFMILAGINFILNYYLLKFDFKKIFENEEFRYYLGITLLASILVALMVYQIADPLISTINHSTEIFTTTDGKQNFTAEASFRHALFSVVSIITTTGFVTADFTLWTPFASMIFFALLFLGGSAGSTSGGVKVIRHVLLIKNGWTEFKRIMHPNAIMPVIINKKAVPQKIVYQVLAFFMIYMLIFIFGSIIMSFLIKNNIPTDKAIMSALTVTATSLGNVGPAFGYFSPVMNFNALTDVGKLFSSFLMILGRLELFTILIILTPTFWRK